MTLVCQIEAGIETGKVNAHLVRKALSDKEINTRGLGYYMLIEDHLRALLINYKIETNDAVNCFNYLVDCVQQDLDWDEDYALSREDAFLELALIIPPEHFKLEPNVPVAKFWDAVLKELRKVKADQAANSLAKFENSKEFARALVQWKEANKVELSRYLQKV